MKIKLEARRIDRVDVTLRLEFDSHAEWMDHTVVAYYPLGKDLGPSARVAPVDVHISWTRLHSGGGAWHLDIVHVSGHEVSGASKLVLGTTSVTAVFHEADEAMPEWLRTVVSEHDPNRWDAKLPALSLDALL